MFHLVYEILRVSANPLFREHHEHQMYLLLLHYNKHTLLVNRKIPTVFVTIGNLFRLLYTNTKAQLLLYVLMMSKAMLILFFFLSNNKQAYQ